VQHRCYKVFCFTNRIHDTWNELPGSVVNSESVTVFKKRLPSVDLSARLHYPCFISIELYFYSCAVYILFTILHYFLLRSYGNVSNLLGSFALNKQQQQHAGALMQ
jgi:uncharacterized membrane protein YbhN (UPF0104 family)